MSIFQELLTVYTETDNRYAIELHKARARGWVRKEKILVRKRELNDHAYFLFMFSRLEDRIRDESSGLIEMSRASIRSWKRRRVWDLLPREKDSDRISFKDRVALLVDKETHHYRDLLDYYQRRNLLAHGGSFTSPVSIPTVVQDFEEFCSMIRQ